MFFPRGFTAREKFLQHFVTKALKGLSKILVGSVTLKTEDVLVMQKFQKA